MAVKQPDFIIIGGGKTAGGASQTLISEIPKGVRNGVNVTFTLSFSPSPCAGLAPAFAIWLFLNGIRQSPYAKDYTLNGNIVTYEVPPASTDQHEVLYFIGPSSGVLPGTARRFAGGTDVVDWGNSSVFNLHGDMSLGIWIRLPSNASGAIFQRGYNDSNALDLNTAFGIAVSGSAGAWSITYGHDHGSGGGSANDHTFLTAIPTSVWRYVGFTRDSVAKTVTLYCGTGAGLTLVGVFTYPDNPDGGTNPVMRLMVGNDSNSGSSTPPFTQYVGDAQEHYLWNRTLTLSEHLAAANGNPDSSSLLLSCPMGTNPELDTSGNANVGNVTGTTLVQGH